jgi:hypothetical protein
LANWNSINFAQLGTTSAKNKVGHVCPKPAGNF